MAAAASWSVTHPVIAIFVTMSIAFGAAAGMSQAESGRISELFVPDDLPAVHVQREIEEIWGESEAAFLYYEVADPTDPDLLRNVFRDMQQAADVSSVERVQGLPSVIEAIHGDFMNIDDATIRATAKQLQGSAAGNAYITENALLVRISFPPADDIPAMTAALDAVADKSQAGPVASGAIYLEQLNTESAGGDVKFLMPLSLLTMVVLLALLFRRFQDVVIPLFTVLVALAMAYGTVAWSGQALAPPSFITMPLLLGLGIDYMLHIVYAYRERPQSETQAQRFAIVGRKVGWPVLYTAATTLIGFGSFFLSNIPQIRTWGLLIGSGALYAFLLAFTLLPALYRLRRKKPRNVSLPFGRVMDVITRVVMGRRKTVLLVVGLMSVGLFAIATQVTVEDSINMANDLDEPAFANLESVQDSFGGQSIALFLVDAGSRAELDSFEMNLAGNVHAGFVDGPIHRLERSSDPLGPIVSPITEGVATPEHWLVRVGYLEEDQDAALEDFEAIVDGSALNIGMTGRGIMEKESQEVFLGSLSKSTGIALGIVVVLLALVFRNALTAGLAFLPLLLTVGWQLGWQTIAGIPLNPITGVMTAMIIGVGVDYSLHIMAHYTRDKEAGMSSLDAAGAAMHSVGRPVLAASVTTVFTFSVLGFSSLEPLQHFGIVAAIAIASAFIVSLTILPILASYLPEKHVGWLREGLDSLPQSNYRSKDSVSTIHAAVDKMPRKA
jgi:predicted RND superfamily exporter protein